MHSLDPFCICFVRVIMVPILRHQHVQTADIPCAIALEADLSTKLGQSWCMAKPYGDLVNDRVGDWGMLPCRP